MKQCEDCIHVRCIPEVVRGVMDCDPAEWYCNSNYDDIFDYENDDPDILDVLAIHNYIPTEEDKEDIKEFINNFNCPAYKRRIEDEY